MNRRSYLVPAAALSVLLTMLSLTQVFVRQAWLGPSILAVVAAFGIGWLGRRLDVPGVLSPALSLLGLVTLLGLLFHPGTTAAGLPTTATMHAIGASLQAALNDIRELAAPANPTDALNLVATVGVFVVATLVDLFVFRLARPVAAGMPLLLLYLVPTAMTTHAGVFPFVAAAAGYLAILVAEGRDRARSWGRRLSGVEHADDVADVSQVARIGRRIGSAAVGVALVAPLLVPNVGKGIFSGGHGPFGHGSGSHTAVVINPIVEIRTKIIAPETYPLLEVRTDRPDYLRMTSLDEFDGNEWSFVKTKDVPSSHKVSKSKKIPLPDQFGDLATSEQTYQVEVGDLTMRWLPLPWAPRSVDVKGDWRYETVGGSVFSSTEDTHDLHYTAVSDLPAPTVDQLQQPGEIPDSMRHYLDHPKNTPQIAIDTLRVATKGAKTPYEKARALNEYFVNPSVGGFTYDLDVGAGNGVDALATFLENKRGYCEQFSATMAYLARLAGIPARVVVGFTPGHQTGSGVYVVTNHDAHAWPELWFPHTGWVRFEPTPRTGTAVPGYAVPLTTPSTPLPGTGGRPSASPTPTARPTAKPKGVDTDTQDPRNQAGQRRAKGASLPVVPLGFLVVVVVCATPSVVGWGVRRSRRRRAADHVGRIHAAWEALEDAAEDAGYPVRAADSPRAAARRLVLLASLAGDPAAEVERLARAEERARYAKSAPPVDGLDASVRTVRHALWASLPRLTRVRAVVFPASSLRRMRSFVRAVVAAVDRTRDRSRSATLALVRRLRPRLRSAA